MIDHILHTPELPSYLTVRVIVGEYPTYTTLNGNTYTETDEGRTVSCEVHSTIHVEPIVKLPSSCSEGYINTYPNRWRGGIIAKVVEMYGLKLEPTRYS